MTVHACFTALFNFFSLLHHNQSNIFSMLTRRAVSLSLLHAALYIDLKSNIRRRLAAGDRTQLYSFAFLLKTLHFLRESKVVMPHAHFSAIFGIGLSGVAVSFVLFVARCYASEALAVMRCLSVRRSVSRSYILSKRINTSSKLFHHQ